MARDSEGRSYPIEGCGKFWSVTTILGILEKPALVQWAANCAVQHITDNIVDFLTSPEETKRILDEAKLAHRDIKDHAADIGTQTHEWIERWLSDRDISLPCDDVVRGAVEAFTKWAESVNLNPIASEIRVFHPSFRYAGRFDLLATLKQGRQRKARTYLIDIKTSSSIYDSMLYQLAAYEEAYRVCDGTHKIDGRGIIRLDKITGKPEWKEYTNIEEIAGWEIFKRLSEVYYLIKGTPNGGNS